MASREDVRRALRRELETLRDLRHEWLRCPELTERVVLVFQRAEAHLGRGVPS